MSGYEFSLPFPPSLNSWTRAVNGRNILTKKGREYRLLVQARMKELGLYGEGVSGRLDVVIYLYGPTNSKRDIDNFLKSPLDALTHSGFWLDDEQVDSLRIVRKEKVSGGRLDLYIKSIT